MFSCSVNFKKYEKTPADISASHTLEVIANQSICNDIKSSQPSLQNLMQPLSTEEIKVLGKRLNGRRQCHRPGKLFFKSNESKKDLDTQALRHENDDVVLEERPHSRARVLEPPRPDPGLKPKDRGRVGTHVR